MLELPKLIGRVGCECEISDDLESNKISEPCLYYIIINLYIMQVKPLLYGAKEDTSMQERSHPIPQFNPGQERMRRIET